MANIITLTFNPCIDKNTTVDKLLPEKKLRCTKPSFGPGGGGINVSRALKNLGAASLAIYPVGGHTGKFLNELMKAEGIETETVQTNSFTRENLIVLESSTGHQFRFGMPGNEITAQDCENLIKLVEEKTADFLVVSGSLLPGMPADIIARVAAIAKDKNSRLVLDTSGEALKKAAEVGVYLLKPNIGELASLAGREQISEDEVEALAGSIIEKGLCQMVAVSMGEKGARLISRNKSVFVQPPPVKPISTLGAGDSMVAGMVYALSKNYSLEEVLKYGVASGTAATITPGTELCRKEDVEALLKKMKAVDEEK